MPTEDEKKAVPFYKKALIDRRANAAYAPIVVEGSDDDEDFKAFVQRKVFAKAAAEEAAAKSLKRSAIDAIAEPITGQIESLGLRARGRGAEADATLRLSEARAGAAMDRVPEMSEATGIPEIAVKGGLSAASSIPYSIPAVAGGPIGLGATVGAITSTGINSASVEGKDSGLRGGSLAVSSTLKGTSDAAAMLVMQKLNLPGLEGIFGKVGKAGAAQSLGKGIADGLRRFGRANIEELTEEEFAMIWGNLLSQWDGTAQEDLTPESLYNQAIDTAAATFAQVSAFSAVAEGTKLYRDQKLKKERAGQPQTPGAPPADPSSPPPPVDPTQPPGPTAGPDPAPAPTPGPAGKAFPIDMQIETIDGILADGQPRTLEELGVEIAKLGLNPESFMEGLAGASKQAAMGGKYELTEDGKVYLVTDGEEDADPEVDTVPPEETQPETTAATPELRKQMWEGYSANDGPFKDDPVVQVARQIEQSRGTVMDEAEFEQMADEFTAAEPGDARKAVADKYIGKQATPEVMPEGQPETTAGAQGQAQPSPGPVMPPVELAASEWVKDDIRQRYDRMNAKGLAAVIEQRSAEGLTAKQIKQELGDDIDILDVNAVRAQLGIPSMNAGGMMGGGTGPQMTQEFLEWQAKYYQAVIDGGQSTSTATEPQGSNELEVWVDGKRQLATVTGSRSDDGTWRIKRVKLSDPETGRYRPYELPDDQASGYESYEQARDEVFGLLKEQFKKPGQIESTAPETPALTDQTTEPAAEVDIRESLWKGYSEQAGDMLDDPVVAAAQYVEKSRGRALARDEFEQFADSFTSAEPGDARMEVAASFIAAPAAPAKVRLGQADKPAKPEATTSTVPVPTTREEIAALPPYSVYQSPQLRGNGDIRFAVRGTSKSGTGDTLHDTPEEAAASAKRQQESDEQETARKAKLAADEAAEAQKEADAVASYRGFLADTPFRFGQARKALEQQVNSGGKVTTRKDLIEDRVKQGWRVVDDTESTALTDADRKKLIAERLEENRRNGRSPRYQELTDILEKGVRTTEVQRFEAPDGTFLDEAAITKSGMRYAKFIADLDQPKTAGTAEAETSQPAPSVADKIKAAIVANGGFEKNSADDVDAIRNSLYEPGGNAPSHADIRAVMQDMKNQQGEQTAPDTEGYASLPAKTRDLFQAAMDGKDAAKLDQILHQGNKALRAEFEARTGFKLPRTNQGTKEVIDAWVAGKQPPPKKAGLGKPKAPATKPKPPEGYEPLAEFRPMVTSIKSPDLQLEDNKRNMKELDLKPGEVVGYRVYPNKKSLDGAYWEYGTVEDSSSSPSHAAIKRSDGTIERVGGERIIRLSKTEPKAAPTLGVPSTEPSKPAKPKMSLDDFNAISADELADVAMKPFKQQDAALPSQKRSLGKTSKSSQAKKPKGTKAERAASGQLAMFPGVAADIDRVDNINRLAHHIREKHFNGWSDEELGAEGQQAIADAAKATVGYSKSMTQDELNDLAEAFSREVESNMEFFGEDEGYTRETAINEAERTVKDSLKGMAYDASDSRRDALAEQLSPLFEISDEVASRIVDDLIVDFEAQYEPELARLASEARAALQPKPDPQPSPKNTRSERLKAKADQAADEWESLWDELGGMNDGLLSMNAMLNPEMQKIAVKLVVAGLKKNILQFAVFIDAGMSRLGESKMRHLGPLLEASWNSILDTYNPEGMDRASGTDAIIDRILDTRKANTNGNEETGTEPDEQVVSGPRSTGMEDGTGTPDGTVANPDGGTDRSPDAESGAGQPGNGVPDTDGVDRTPDGRPEPTGNGEGTDSGSDSIRGPESTVGGPAATDTRAGSPGETVSAANPNAVNHRIGPNDALSESGVVASYRLNVDAIRLLKQLEAEGRNATPEEKQALAKFTGWGGIAPVFDSAQYAQWERYLQDKERRPYSVYPPAPKLENWAKTWFKRHAELKELLTDAEWQAGRTSTENAHYTDRGIISSMWSIAEKLGFRGGTVAEFGAGVGHFAGLMPDSLTANSKFLMIEKDSLSARIAAKLYPQSEVVAKALEEVELSPASVSLVIGNVPFSERGPGDAVDRYGRSLNLHNYFFARMADALAPGGIAVVISSHHTLDAQSAQRKFLAERMDLLGAIRLPNNAFQENAKTKVTTDILVFRKKEGGVQVGESMLDTEVMQLLDSTGKKVPVSVNSYFAKHPEMALGIHSATGQLRGKPGEYTLEPNPDIGDLTAAVANAAAKIKTPTEIGMTATDGSAVVQDNANAVAEGAIRMEGGVPVVYAGGKWVKVGEGSRPSNDIPAGLFAGTAVARATDYIALRESYADLRKVMTDPDSGPAEVREAQGRMAQKYDAYVKKHDALNDKKTRIFAMDPEYARVISLEKEVRRLDPDTKQIKSTYEKADVFTKRTLGANVQPQSADTLRDAAYISLGMKGRIDVPYIAQLRSQTVEQARQELLADDTMFQDPSTGEIEFQEEYLSGNVRKKLAEAQVAARSDSRFERNIAALQAVQPEPRKLDGKDPIAISLGDRWIPIEVVQAFTANYLRVRPQDVEIAYSETLDAYEADVFNMGESKYSKGVDLPQKKISASEVLKKVLNLDTHGVVTIKVDDVQVAYPEGTAAFRHAVHTMQTAFAKFVKENEAAKKATEDAYNNTKNAHRDAVYDGSHLTLPGKNPAIKLREYQQNVIWRIIKTGRVLMAHAVGAGKTYSLIGAAMELKRLGMAKRSVIVVQKSTLGQFAKSFMEMYPNANVLVATSADLGKGKREAFLHRIASGDFDAVVIANSTFQNLASSKESEKAYIESIVREAEEELVAMRQQEGKDSPNVKALVKYLNGIRSKLKKLSDSGDTARAKQAVTFDDLGVDAIFLDEAHAYKKPFFLTRMQQLVGLNKTPSIVAMGTQAKIATIRSKTGGRNIVLATGTPVTNTLGEAYHMATYLSPEFNADHGVSSFDRFIGSFATVNTILKQNAGGEMVPKPAIEKFRNGSELIRYLRRTWDIVTPDQLRDQVNTQAEKEGKSGIPKIRGGVPELVTVPRPKSTGRFMNYLLDAFRRYQQLSGEDRRTYSYIPLLLQGSARTASMDLRLIYPDAAKEPGGKVDAAANRIWQEYLASKDINGTQLVFSDIKNPRSMDRLKDFMNGVVSYFTAASEQDVEEDDFDDEGNAKESEADKKARSFLFDQITAELVKKGIPRNQIAYITDAKTDAQKMALYAKANSGEIRVLMGGTTSLGTGVNVQERVVALHELDAVYMPSESEQRWARALRFGNINKEVAIVRYAMKNTLDGAIYDAVLRKAKFIWQVLAGKAGNEFDDPVSEVTISLEEAVAAISGSPLPREKILLEHEIRDLISSRTAFEEQQQAAKSRLASQQRESKRLATEVVPRSNARVEEIATIAKSAKDDGVWVDVGDGKRIADVKQIDAFFSKAIAKITDEIVAAAKKKGDRPDTRDYRSTMFTMNGMEAWIEADSIYPTLSDTGAVTDWTATAAVRLALPSEPNLNLYHGSAKTASGAYQQILKLADVLTEAAADNQKRLEDINQAIVDIESGMDAEWEDAGLLAEKQARLEAVKLEIQAGSLVDRETDDDDDAPPAGPIDVSDLMSQTEATAEDVGGVTHVEALQQGDDSTPPEPPRPIDAPPPPGVASFIAPELQKKKSLSAGRQVVFSAADLIADYESDQDSPEDNIGPDEQFEAEWADSRKGLVPRTLYERLVDFMRSIPKQLARGAFAELPRTEELGEARSLLRIAKDAPNVAVWQTGLLLKKTTDAMSAKDMDLFARAVIFRNFKHRTGALPFGLSGERADAERNRVEGMVSKSPVVQAALQYRSEWQEEVKESYIYWNRRIGIDMSDRLHNQEYFHHQVLWHYRVNETTRGGQKQLRPNLGRGFLKRAYGSELNINANYIQAEWEVTTQMIADTIRAESMAKLIEQYDRMPALEHAAKMANLYTFYGGKKEYDYIVKLREERQKAKRKDKPAISAELKKLDPLFQHKVNIAIASQRLLSMEPWLASLPSAAFFKEVNRLSVDSRNAASDAATAFLGAIQAQEQTIQDALGDNYRTWRDMVPDTHRPYALRPGRAMFTAHSLPEKLANDLLTGHAKSLNVQADMLREVLVMGHEFTPVVMPNEVVSQLEDMARTPGDTIGAKWAQFFTAVQRKWKGLRLLGPMGFLKYNIRNTTEIDKVLNFIPQAASWPLMKRALTELLAAHSKSNDITDDMRKWMELGGAQALALPNELTDLRELKEFARFFEGKKVGLGSVPAKLWKGYWSKAAGFSNYRESVLRYSAYLAFKAQIEANNGTPTNYGASTREEVDGIRDIDRKAIRLANDVLGDYGDVSPVGQTLRNGIVPFWAFPEVNFRSYIRGIRNLAYDEPTAIAAGKSIAKAIGVTAVARSPVLAMRLGRIALLLYGMQAGLTAWNLLLFGDEEDELPDEVKKRPHVILGRNPDGSIRYFDRLGTSTDFLDWMGLDSVDFMVKSVLDGRMSLKDVAVEMVMSPANKAVQSLTPALKVPAGMLLGKDTFPDIRELRTIRDKKEYLAQAFGLEKPYRVVAGVPTKGRLHDMRSLLWYEVDAGAAAYYRNRDEIAKFTGRGAFSSDSITPRAEALYYYKQALRYGDEGAQAKYRAEYEAEGGTQKTLLQSLKMLHPLGTLSVPDEIRYLAKLDSRGKEELAQAEQYFYKTLVTPAEAEAVKASRANRVVDAVKTALTHAGRPNPATNSDYETAMDKYQANYADIKQWVQDNRELPNVKAAIREVIRSDRFKSTELGTVPQPRPKMANETERKYRERLKASAQAARQAKEDAKAARQWRRWLTDPSTPLN